MQEYLNHKKLSLVKGILLKAQHKYKETWLTTPKLPTIVLPPCI